MDFDSYVREALADLEQRALLRAPRPVAGPQGPELNIQGRPVLGLCSNNYLGLAGDPRLVQAAASALEQTGLGAGASRHISGSNTLHVELEARLAAFVGHPAALFFSNGYAANVGTLQALVGRGDVIFSDSLNHASLIDGARLSRAHIVVFRHLDLAHLRELLVAQRAHHRNALVVSESVFSMEGDFADLPALRALCDAHRCGLVVDEAHGLGVLGPQGRGLAAETGTVADVLIGTLGKAFGCAGAFVAGQQPTIRLIENRARSYVFSTAPPPSLAAAAGRALDLVAAADDRRVRLRAHAERLRVELRALGYRVPDGRSPIVPVLIGPPQATMAISAALLERGVFVHGIRPPTVPPGTSRLRVTPMATHTEAQIDQALSAFAACRNLL